MKAIYKYLGVFLCGIVLVMLAVYAQTKVTVTPPAFLVCGSDEQEAKKVTIFDAGDGNYCVFLPSYADMERVTVSVEPNQTSVLNEVTLYDGMHCGAFEMETQYAFQAVGMRHGTLQFYKSANVATMHIDTVTGDMTEIHKDKNHEEYASVTLLSADGDLLHADRAATIKGRGNSTWTVDKRPYSLMLSAAADLLGMEKAVNWVLLPNASDKTNLNNKLVLELANRTGTVWAPKSNWVDIYLNGEYAGLYLLAEKVEVSGNRLNIDTNAGDFLCKVEYPDRWDSLRNPFLTEAGRTVEICEPRALAENEKAEIVEQVNRMERELLSGADLRSSEIIDLDSWVRRYLIDEIAANMDADFASSYFYFQNGVCYAGPVWDYDLSFGNKPQNQDPEAFLAKNRDVSDIAAQRYYAALCANESFHKRMVEIYQREFVPMLREMLNGEIDEMATSLSRASEANSLRWHSIYDWLQSQYPDLVFTPRELQDYLNRRLDFLGSAWVENEQYCTLQFDIPDRMVICVRKGNYLNTTDEDILSNTWIDAETGGIVDFSQPIIKDMILLQPIAEEDAQEEIPAAVSLITADYIALLSIPALIILLAGFALVDKKRRCEERGTTDAQSGNKIPS